MGNLIRFRRKGKREDEHARPLFPPFRAVSPGGTDARPSNRFPSDASPIPDLPRAGRAPDPEIVRKRRLRRSGAIFAFAVVFMAGVAAALFGDRGYLDVRRQATLRSDMQQAYNEHLKRVQDMQREIARLKSDPFAVERIAREELGYVAPNEVTLLLPGDDPKDAHRLDEHAGSAIVPAVRSTP